MNKIPSVFNLEEVKEQVENTYNCEVAALLPHSDEMMVLGSSDVFAIKFPDHPVTDALNGLADRLLI